MTDDNKITAISNTFLKWSALTDHILSQYSQALLIVIDWTKAKEENDEISGV